MHQYWLTLTFLALSFTSGAVASANLVSNPGFETGDFTDWTSSGNTDFTFVDGFPHSGSFAAWFGPTGSLGFLSQTLATVPGDTYELRYWLQHDPFGSGTPNAVQVFWDGSPIRDDVDVGAFQYTEFVVSNLVATGASTNLTFGFREDTDFFQLDDISVEGAVQPVPEPGTLLLLGMGLLILVALVPRLRKVNATWVGAVALIVTVPVGWVLGAAPTHAQITDFTPEGIQAFLAENPQVGTAAEFLQNLPLDFHYNWVMMTNSESSQTGTATSPRFIMFDLESKRVFGFNADDSKTIEYLHFEDATNKFRFHEITMQTGGGTIEIDKARCLGCHASPRGTARGHGPRPNWDAYDSWGGALPFNRDRIYPGSEEEKAMKRILNAIKNTDFGLQVGFPPGIIDDVTTGMVQIEYKDCDPGIDTNDSPCKTDVGNGKNFLRIQSNFKRTKTDEGPAVAMFDQFTGLNALRIAQELVDFPRDPVDIRPVALAITKGCVTAANLGKYAPKAALTRLLAFHTSLDSNITTFQNLLDDTRARMKSLPSLKKALQVENFKDLIAANGSVGASIDAELARRSNMNPGQTFTVDPASGLIDREFYDNNGEVLKLASLRLFLEPLGVAVETWSMSVQSDVAPSDRNRTYTFGDLFTSIYIPALAGKLTAALGFDTCSDLSAASIKQYVRGGF